MITLETTLKSYNEGIITENELLYYLSMLYKAGKLTSKEVPEWIREKYEISKNHTWITSAC